MAHKTYCAVLITYCTQFLGIAMYTDFLRSVGISPVSSIMLRSFVISLIPNSPRAVSISDGMSSGPADLSFSSFYDLLNFLLKNLGAFIIIDQNVMGLCHHSTALWCILITC